MSKKTPAEIREQQEAAQHALEERRAASHKAFEEQRSKETAETAAKIKEGWYTAVEAAAKRATDLRFVVVAKVVGQPAAAAEVMEAIRADGYKCDTIPWFQAQDESAIIDSKPPGCKGWLPKGVRTLGSDGGVYWLVVRW